MRLVSRLAIVLAILLFVPVLWEQFEAPKAIAIRVLGIGVLGAGLASALRRGSKPQAGPGIGPLDVAMAAWLLVEVVTTALSRAPRLSLFGDVDQHDGLLTSLGLAGLYLAARLAHRVAADLAGTRLAFAAAAAIACAYGLAQAIGLDPAPWRDVAQYLGGRFTRPASTLGHPNLLGMISAAGFAIAAGRLAAGARARAGWIAAAALFAAATVFTLSRAAWLGALAGVAIAVPMSARAGGPARSRGATLAMIASLVAVLVLFASVGLLRARVIELFTATSGPSRARLEIWRTALQMWRASAWVGTGPDTFALFFERFQTAEYWNFEWGARQFHAHSVYLHLLATRGVLGVAAAAGAAPGAIAALRRGWSGGAEARGWTAGVAGALGTFAVAGAFGALGNAGAALLFVLLGTLAGFASPAPASAAPPGGRPEGGKSARRAARFRISWPGVAVGAAVLVLHVGEWRASLDAHAARAYAPASPDQIGDPTSRLAADRAADRQPRSDWLQNLRAEIYLGHAVLAEPYLSPGAGRAADPAALAAVRGWLAEGERSALRAVALEPRRPVNSQTLGNIRIARAKRGDPGAIEAALDAYRRCWEWAPMNALARDQFAFEMLAAGRADLAIEPARRAAELYPREALTQSVLAHVQLATGDSAAAAASLERALAGAWDQVPYPRADLERLRDRLRAGR